MMIRLVDFAKSQGVCYRTAYNWFYLGYIEGAYQTASRTILVPKDAKVKRKGE